jgi:hypothetical protein
MGLSSYLRQIAIETAMRLRQERIRAQSRSVGEYVATSPEAAAFYEEWGTPRLKGIDVAKFSADQIVIVDWRDALPKEPNKLRPGVVVEDESLLDPAYPNVILALAFGLA